MLETLKSKADLDKIREVDHDQLEQSPIMNELWGINNVRIKIREECTVQASIYD